MKRKSLGVGFIFVFFYSCHSFAATELLNSLAGTWNDLEAFVTLDQCASGPWDAQLYLCNPAAIAAPRQAQFEAGGFLSATDSLLSLGDTMRQGQINSADLLALANSYNYSEALFNAHFSYLGKNWLVGIRPARIQGQFQVHNLNLPYGSLTYREETDLYAGTGFSVRRGNFLMAFGAQATVLTRNEVIAEDTIAALASVSASSLLQSQRMNGAFFDLGTIAQVRDAVSVSVVFKDLGWFWQGVDRTSSYLFVYQDRFPRCEISASWIPTLLTGNLQLGAQAIGLLDAENSWSDQWFGTVSYYVGPLKILSGFRPGLFRTGLLLKFGKYEASVAQEWINQIEPGRVSQPRFILGASVGL